MISDLKTFVRGVAGYWINAQILGLKGPEDHLMWVINYCIQEIRRLEEAAERARLS